ncbi:MAG: glucose/arabinose dehydrogenase [Kiritimatiellia bacterium]|jgi:glucose/arabinose dehydrogenase
MRAWYVNLLVSVVLLPVMSRGAGIVYHAGLGPVVGTAASVGQTEQGKNVSFRANIVPLNADASAGMVFDADTLRMAGGWVKGTLSLDGLPFTGGHGSFPHFDGEPLFIARAAPGWANGSGSFDEPRVSEVYPPLGPLPRAWAKFKGHYLHGDQAVFSYSVGTAEVLEMAGIIGTGDTAVLTRTVQINGAKAPMKMVIAEGEASIDGMRATIGETHIVVAHAAKAKLVAADGRLVLELPAGPAHFIVGYSREAKPEVAAPQDLQALTKGGPARWTESIETKGEVSTDTRQAYVIDRLTVPYNNPYKVKLRIGGMDFFSDGTRAAVSTWDGDVWIISGIDDTLEKLTWKRYASGLHEALGLRILDDVIYTVADDQITRFHDVNEDGEADFYECFNNDWDLTSGFHAFCFDLQTDPEGNFYFAFGSPVRGGGRSFERMGEHHGSILKVSADGQSIERYASGLRAPNGMGVSPSGQVTSGDNEGTFVPRSPINWIKRGSFLGVADSYAKYKELKTTPTVEQRQDGRAKHLDLSEMPKPLAWLPKQIDNSGGGQAWVTGDRWGPFNGELLHMSYGQSSLYLVLKEEKNGQMQGGVVKFPLKFTSSAMRARMNPKDGQLYVAGLKGWQSNAAKEGGFDRVRYTGVPVAMPAGLHAVPGGLAIRFTQALDRELAEDTSSYGVKACNIHWTHDYGSAEYLVGKDDTKGWTPFTVKSARLSADGKTVTLEIPDIEPVHMMEISIDVETKDGDEIITKINSTLHEAG